MQAPNIHPDRLKAAYTLQKRVQTHSHPLNMHYLLLKVQLRCPDI